MLHDIFYVIFGIISFLFGLIRDTVIECFEDIFGNISLKFETTKSKYSEKFEARLSSLKKHYCEILATNKYIENPPISKDATQIFTNILELQRQRLSRLGINVILDIKRMLYTDDPIHEYPTRFDGKYDIHEIKESVQVHREYVHDSDSKVLYKNTASKMAHYTLIQARTVGGKKIICPNCGCETTREDLLDGCDFCHTKFMIEDLGSKASAISFLDDTEMEYSKYRKIRSAVSFRVFLFSFIIWTALIGIAFYIGCIDEGLQGTEWVEYAFYALMMGGIFGAFLAAGTLILYWVTLFPFIQARASITYYTKKQLDKKKKAADKSAETELKAREYDRLFSLYGFYSGLQNKLASIIFADTPAQINSFSSGDLSPMLKAYANAVDFEVLDFFFDDFKVEDGLQKSSVTADINIMSYDKTRERVTKSPQKIKLRLIKSADCKTEAVCAPRIMICESCGASLSLLDGMTCRYCNAKLDMKKYDWVIDEYEF